MMQLSEQPIRPDYSFLQQVEKESGIKASACFQCRKCSGGCPLSFAMDYHPDQIVRFLLLGLEEVALNSSTIWVCSSCETCTTRCPNGIDIAGLMDYLKQKARERGIVDPHSNPTYAFHETFLTEIAKRGRIHEIGLLNRYMLKSGAWKGKLHEGTLWNDVKMALALVRRQRLPILPKGIKQPSEIQQFFVH